VGGGVVGGGVEGGEPGVDIRHLGTHARLSFLPGFWSEGLLPWGVKVWKSFVLFGMGIGKVCLFFILYFLFDFFYLGERERGV
jgi:hypothetical protein